MAATTQRLDGATHWPALDGTDRALVMFTVFRFPSDFLRHFVVRRSFVLPDGEIRHDVVPRLATDLPGARALVPPGLYRQERVPGEPAQIVEVWF
jgi:hypothetical protein